MKTLSIVACVAWMNAAVVAQLPPQLSWGNYFQPTRLTGISLDPNGGFCQTDMASDGYGHHYVTVVNNQVVYSLLDNSGTVIRSYNFGPNTLHPSITSFFDLGTQLTRQHIILQQGSNLVLFRSTDGGTTWNSLPTLPIQGSLVSIDSYEDLTGIHITYGSSLGIYHHLRNRTPDGWAVLNPFVAALAPPPPPFSYYNFPSVIASSDSAHIYTQQGLYSRRLTENSWTPAQALILNAYWPATLTRTVEDDTEYIRAWIWGEVNPPNSYYGGVTSTRRRLFNAAQWGAADPPSQEAEGELTGWKPQCNNAGSVFRYVYNRAPADGARVYYGDYVVGGFLISEENRASRTPAISSDITGIAVVWWDVPSGTAYLRRRPLGVSDASTGSVVDNYTFSDTTWVTGTLTVAPGKQLRLKSGSVTYLWGPYSGGGPGSLIMSDGSSLVVESNAQFIMNAGSGIVFGPNSSMTVTGLLRVNGTSTQRVTFTRSGSSGTWPGIVIDNYSCAYTSNINYAAISYANTGISTRTDARLAINNTTFDNAAIGIEIIPPGDHAPTTPPPMQINDCKLTNITTTGIFDNGLSTLTLLRDTIISTSSPGPYPSGIVLTSASPKILASRIKNFYYGMRCTNYSSPMLEDGTTRATMSSS